MMTSIAATEHSTVTSWGKTDENAEIFQKNEREAFVNFLAQYHNDYARSCVSDGFNIWNAITNIWTDENIKEPRLGNKSSF